MHCNTSSHCQLLKAFEYANENVYFMDPTLLFVSSLIPLNVVPDNTKAIHKEKLYRRSDDDDDDEKRVLVSSTVAIFRRSQTN